MLVRAFLALFRETGPPPPSLEVLKRRPSPRAPAAPGAAAKPEAVVEKLEEMGDFVKLPDFLPVPSAGLPMKDATSSLNVNELNNVSIKHFRRFSELRKRYFESSQNLAKTNCTYSFYIM